MSENTLEKLLGPADETPAVAEAVAAQLVRDEPTDEGRYCSFPVVGLKTSSPEALAEARETLKALSPRDAGH